MTAGLSPVRGRSRTDAVLEAIIALARRTGSGGRLPPVRELAASLQVSLSTLDRALEDLEQRRVIRREHVKGMFVAEGIAARTAGLVIGFDPFESLTPAFYPAILRSAERCLAAAGVESSVYGDVPGAGGLFRSHQDLDQDLEVGRIHGLIYLGVRHPGHLDRLRRERGVPVAAFTDTPVAPWRIYPDYPGLVSAGIRAVLAAGARRPALIAYPSVNRDLHEGTVRAFRSALAEAGLDAAAAPVVDPRHDPAEDLPGRRRSSNEERGLAAGLRLFGGPGPVPDAVVSVDDQMTRGLLVALHRHGLAPGAGVRIATHENRGTALLAGYADRLIRLEMDVDALAVRLLALLDAASAPEASAGRVEAITHAAVVMPPDPA